MIALLPLVLAGQHVWLDAGWDPTWTVEAGYGHELGELRGLGLVAGEVSLTVPVVLLDDLDGARLSLGAAARPRLYNGLGAPVAVVTTLVWAESPLGRQLGWGLDLEATPGLWRDHWGAGLLLGWRPGLATRFWHSDAVEDLFEDRYPDGTPATVASGPSGAWIAFPVNRLRAGIAGELVVSEHFSVALEGTGEWTPQAQGIVANPQLGQLPFTTHLRGTFRW